VLKFDPHLLRHGEDARAALDGFCQCLARVAASGGCVVGHNVWHDIEQLRATASLIGYEPPTPYEFHVLDTVKTASAFVPTAEPRWMRLEELAKCCGIGWHAAVETLRQHRAAGDVQVLRQIVAMWYDPRHLPAYYEPCRFP
jgi:DNA polymerase III epsilon subunit-like protein